MGVYFRSRRGRYLGLLNAGLALALTPAWVLLDEFVLDWTGWLPAWPSVISNGLLPLGFLLLGLALLDRFLKSILGANQAERILSLFIFLFTALIVLTVIGIYFRGAGMALVWPWELAAPIRSIWIGMEVIDDCQKRI